MAWMLILIWINSNFTRDETNLDDKPLKVNSKIVTQLAKEKLEPKEPFSSDGDKKNVLVYVKIYLLQINYNLIS